jgi:transposase
MTIKTIGLDLDKLVFQIHGVDEHGHVVLRKQVSRSQLPAFFAKRLKRLQLSVVFR